MQVIMEYIIRNQVIEKIRPYIGNSLIKVLVGQRRVGKSYLLYQIMDELKKSSENQIIYINKEDFEFDSIKSYDDLIAHVNKELLPNKKVALFIDEIQEIKSFEKALRHFQTKNTFDIYCTGSNANMLAGELATLLAGRYIQIPVYSLSYREFLSFHEQADSSESLLNYFKYGGMPHLINLRNNEAVYYEYLQNVFSSIVLKDIIARYNIRNVNFLQDLIRFLANNIGSIVSAKRISDYLKSQQLSVQPRSVQEYLYYLESVLFIKRVKRTEIEGRKIFEIGDKFYFEDLGMRNAIIPFQMKDINKILENAVYHHLRVNGYNVFVGKDGVKEIDFVAEKGNKTFYIQVAYIIADEITHKREFGNLLAINDNHTKMVISMDEMAEGNFKGIEHWHIRRFLMEF
ncbi:MAG: ATP-binding protein [Salinivirgaceae bacterium]|nr:ATP-binding protein [Salinivirgaceae bacterium]